MTFIHQFYHDNKSDWRRVLDILDEGNGWTQDAEARDRHGQAVDPLSDDAECFCIQGAVFRACDGDYTRIRTCLNQLADALVRANGEGQSVFAFNDACGREFRQIEALILTILAPSRAKPTGDENPSMAAATAVC